MAYGTLQRALAEFVGTFALVFVGAGSIVVAITVAPEGGAGLVSIGLAHGLAIAVMVTAVGHVSGGHFNPAVTFGALITGKIDALHAGVYWLSQLLAGVAGAGLLRAALPASAWDPVALGVPAVDLELISSGQAVLIEAILTFLLVWVIFGAAIDPDSGFKPAAGLAIGFTVMLDIMMGGPLTGAAMNPARWFGPALVSGTWDVGWVWIVGPLVGGGLAAVVYDQVILRPRSVPAA